jgi:zinc-ribbon domain
MYCPECGTSNQQGQKFCTRCGTNLIVVEYARELVAGRQGEPAVARADPSLVLKVVALISIFGFLFVTGAMIALTVIQFSGPVPNHGPPMGVFAGMGGFAALVLICRQLLKLAGGPAAPEAARPAAPALPLATGATNRSLGSGSPAYQSVTEEKTRQFEGQRRG